MIPRAINKIAAEDLHGLLVERIREDKSIEYKREVPTDKFDILKDVSAFANTQGGDIIFGVEEGKDDNRGVPVSLVGVPNVDESVRRILDIVRTGLQPPLLLKELNFKPVEFAPARLALVLRVPESLSAPHQIRERFVFYARNSGENYLMDAGELRTAFILQETLAARIRTFRIERLEKIKGGNAPVSVDAGPCLILHLIPQGAFLTRGRLDIGANLKDLRAFLPLSRTIPQLQHLGYRINLDGLVNYYGNPEAARSYTQVYRSGILEAVKTLQTEVVTFTEVEEPFIVSNQFPAHQYKGYEGQLIEGLNRYTELLSDLGIEPPIYVFVTLCDVTGHRLFASQPASTTYSQHFIDQNDLLLPEEIIESQDIRPEVFLRPIFDMIWNAAGDVGCPNYDQKGGWIGP